ncbi:MAG TPA: hypothetical protein VIJ14_09820 [Rhabdochlamydiaceae bacterium]
MNISPVNYSTISDYPIQIQHTQEMNQISTSIGQMNDAHEQRKKETDEINNQTYA